MTSASSLTTAPTCTTAVTAVSPVGSYPCSCSGAADANYAISYIDGTVTIGPASLSITASSVSSVYGQSVPPIEPLISGLQNGEDASVLGSGLTCSTTATSASPVGSYPSSCSGAADANYAISYTAGSVAGRPRHPHGDGFVGDDDLRGFGPRHHGVLRGIRERRQASSLTNSPICSTSATSSSPVGTYPSACSGASDANYTISYVAGAVQVTTAPLVVAASSPSMTYGCPVPTITASYSGFVNGDNASSLTTAPTCSTTATSTSPVGQYPSTLLGSGRPELQHQLRDGRHRVGTAALVVRPRRRR